MSSSLILPCVTAQNGRSIGSGCAGIEFSSFESNILTGLPTANYNKERTPPSAALSDGGILILSAYWLAYFNLQVKGDGVELTRTILDGLAMAAYFNLFAAAVAL